MTAKRKTMESEVADAILQEPLEVVIDGTTYSVPQPTVATLVKVSKYISYLPSINADTDNVLLEMLRKAKDCKTVGKIAAIMVLGAKRVNENRVSQYTRYVVKTKNRHWWQRKRTANIIYTTVEKVALREVDWLAGVINERMSIVELRDLLLTLLGSMQVADFFGITISLSATNLTKPAKEMVKGAAHGAS